MEIGQVIFSFLDHVQNDPRISPVHICIYLAVLMTGHRKGNIKEVVIYKKQLIRKAKISGRTYQRCMKDLQMFGYLQYEPSFSPVEGSIVRLNFDL